MPKDVQLVVQALFSADMPQFVGLDSNSDLQVAVQASLELVVSVVVMPEGAQCHAPNRFGTVNMEDNINIKRS